MAYKRNRKTIYPLSPTDRELFLAKLNAPHPDWMPMYGLDPKKVVLFLYHTGCHPDVMVHPSMRMLNVDLTTNLVNWARPKNDHTMGIPIHPDIRPWVADFVADLKAKAPPCELGMVDRSGGRHAIDGRKDSRPVLPALPTDLADCEAGCG